jgi:hypothetical protein
VLPPLSWENERRPPLPPVPGRQLGLLVLTLAPIAIIPPLSWENDKRPPLPAYPPRQLGTFIGSSLIIVGPAIIAGPFVSFAGQASFPFVPAAQIRKG